MAETLRNVRLVRCPKCENLLPEVTDFSVYRCGGCGAVLRAKNNKSVKSDTFSEKSDEESLGGSFYKFSENHENANISSRRGMNSDVHYENDVKPSGISSSRAGEYNNGLLTKAEKWVVEEDLELNKNAHELGISKTAQRFKGLKLENESSENGSRRSVQTYDRITDEGDMDRFQNTKNSNAIGLMKSEGPPNYRSGYDYDYAGLVNNRNGPGTVNKAEFVEDDRAELLRKLDELKDQISRSGQMVDRSKEKIPHIRRVGYQDPYRSGPENWFPDGLNRVPMNYPMAGNMARPQYSNYSDTSSYTSNQGLGAPYGSNMVRRAPQHVPELFEQRQFRPYYSGQYINNGATDMDLHDNYPHNFHHPSCSCYQCYNKHEQVGPPHIVPSILPNGRFSDVPHYHENPNGFAPRDYNPRFSNNQSVNSNHSRWSGDLDSEFGGLVRAHPQRVLLATTGHRCRPVSGGAPFITCNTCFELLQLPKKLLNKGKIKKKMKCASCSELIFISVVDNKLVLSVHSQPEEVQEKVEIRSYPIVNEGNSHMQSSTNLASTELSSDEYDNNSGYDFKSMDEKVISSPAGPSFGSNKSAAMRSHRSTSSCTSTDEEELPKAAELATITNPTPPPPSDSPLQDHSDHSTNYNRAGSGNSMKEATEIEIPSNEYPNNTGTSQESGDATREEQMKGSGGSESFFAGIKKSFRDFSRSSQHVEEENNYVTVNSHFIPDRLVKKAEKLAGNIQPGNYWYDSRAGFWGVIGGPCCGIIPPFIEEFNYPMPEKCGGGNTGVFVNGRELNQNDLEMLGSRGLPTDVDGSYIIEISGRVVDVESGEELDCLGKLAPTVERAKRGFGMKVPRATS